MPVEYSHIARRGANRGYSQLGTSAPAVHVQFFSKIVSSKRLIPFLLFSDKFKLKNMQDVTISIISDEPPKSTTVCNL